MLRRSDIEFCGPGCRTCAQLRDAVVRHVGELGILGVSLGAIADRARVSVGDASVHRAGDVTAWLGDAYFASVTELQTRFVSALSREETWRDGLASATRALLQTLADDPARARFCYVEILEGPEEVAHLRERLRARSVDLLAQQYAMRRASNPIPCLHLEITHGVIVSAIERSVRAGKAAEMPALADVIVAAVEPEVPAAVA